MLLLLFILLFLEKMDFEIKCVYPRRVNVGMIAALPLVKYEGELELVENESQLERVLAEISREQVLGFDTETRPNFNRGKQYQVSILQLAGENKVWIIRLDALAEHLPEIFKVLENPSVKKAGLAVQGDIKSLRARQAFTPAGFVDVSASTTKIGIINTGMKNLVALIFGERISKAAQLSNWASEELNQKQLDYAATDAWISRRLFLEVREILKDERTDIEPEPIPEPEHFNLISFIRKAIRKVSEKITPKKKHTVRRKTKSGLLDLLFKKKKSSPERRINGGNKRGGRGSRGRGGRSGGKRRGRGEAPSSNNAE